MGKNQIMFQIFYNSKFNYEIMISYGTSKDWEERKKNYVRKKQMLNKMWMYFNARMETVLLETDHIP